MYASWFEHSFNTRGESLSGPAAFDGFWLAKMRRTSSSVVIKFQLLSSYYIHKLLGVKNERLIKWLFCYDELAKSDQSCLFILAPNITF